MSFRVCVATALAFCLATVASAEIYRWTDAAGREHFTAQLQSVPAEHREAAKARAQGSSGNLNFHALPEPTARDVEPPPATPAAADPGAAQACAAARKQVKVLMKPIRYHQRKLETHERGARDIARNEYSRRRSEIRAEKAREWLDKAQRELDAFRNARRREGLEPGCLR